MSLLVELARSLANRISHLLQRCDSYLNQLFTDPYRHNIITISCPGEDTLLSLDVYMHLAVIQLIELIWNYSLARVDEAAQSSAWTSNLGKMYWAQSWLHTGRCALDTCLLWQAQCCYLCCTFTVASGGAGIVSLSQTNMSFVILCQELRLGQLQTWAMKGNSKNSCVSGTSGDAYRETTISAVFPIF